MECQHEAASDLTDLFEAAPFSFSRTTYLLQVLLAEITKTLEARPMSQDTSAVLNDNKLRGVGQAMRIGIELRRITLGNAGGMAFLLKWLLETLFRNHPEHHYTVYGTVFNRALLQHCPDNVRFKTLDLAADLAQIDHDGRAGEFDVLFRSYPHLANLTFPAQRQIYLIPDIQHAYFPEFFQADVLAARCAAFRDALGSAGAIATISEFARATLLEQEFTRCQDIFLVTPALNGSEDTQESASLTAAELALVPHDFFLYPANLWPHKNHRRVLRAFEEFVAATGSSISFVFTGHPEGWSEIQREFPTLPIRHLGFVRQPLLRTLFKKARGLVYFSLYEGFGMPLLEAFAAGLPVICSNTTSLPEVGQDAVLSCDPTDVKAMSQLMGRITQDQQLCQELVTRGKERLKAFSWKESAEHLNAAFERGAARARASATTLFASRQTRPLVSIVTPSYNQGRFLRRTIDSVLSQTYPRIEYRVIDGGSRDESVGILKSYGGRISWVCEPDGGQSQAINKGFSRANGEIRAYLNSDDVLLPEAVAKVVDHFGRHPECDLAYGRAHYIDEQDCLTGQYNTAEYSFERLMEDCCICQPAAFWTSRIAEKVGPFNESLRYAMDFDYWIRIHRGHGQIMHLDDFLACSRLYPATKTKSARREIYREIFQVCQREAGFIHISYFYGLWNYLCFEREHGWPRLFRAVPRFVDAAVRLHYRLANRRHALRTLFARVKGFTKRASSLGARRRTGAVTGFRCDNWLEPECEIVVTGRTPREPLYLVGTAPLDTVLRVETGGQKLTECSLPANTRKRIEIAPAPPGLTRLRLRFSRSVHDTSRNRISFLLEDTNLFGERDLCA